MKISVLFPRRRLAGASIPSEAMMHFPLFHNVHLFSTNFRFRLFHKKFDFHPPKFLMTFLVITHKFEIFPLYFSFLTPLPPLSEKCFIPPILPNSPPDFVKFPYFVHAFCDCCFPLL